MTESNKKFYLVETITVHRASYIVSSDNAPNGVVQNAVDTGQLMPISSETIGEKVCGVTEYGKERALKSIKSEEKEKFIYDIGRIATGTSSNPE